MPLAPRACPPRPRPSAASSPRHRLPVSPPAAALLAPRSSAGQSRKKSRSSTYCGQRGTFGGIRGQRLRRVWRNREFDCHAEEAWCGDATIRKGGEKILISSSAYRVGKPTENIAGLRHHPLDGVGGRRNVVDEADSLSGQPGHLFPIGLRVLGCQNYVEFTQHHVLAKESGAADLG